MKVSGPSVSLLTAGSVLIAGCEFRPPQTETFVLHGSSPEAVDHFVRETAQRLRLKVSQKTFDTPAGASRDYEASGGGLSIFVLQAMREGCAGPDGNYPRPQVDPDRYDVLAAKTGVRAQQT